MKILFTSEEVIDICEGKYYSMNLGQHLAKYSYMGEIICVCYCREVKKTKLPEIDMNSAKFVFTQKETSVSTKLFGSRKNHEIIQECAKVADMVVAHVPSWNSEHSIAIAKQMGLPYMTVVVGCIWDSMWNYDWRGKLLAIPEFIKQKCQVSNSHYALYVTEYFLQKRYPCDGVTEHASNVCIEPVSKSVLDKRLAKIRSYTDGCQLNIATVAAVNVRYKGQEYVIRAIAKLNKEKGLNYHYYLVGGGDNSFLKEIVKKYEVESYVHFIGALPHEKVIELLDNMDLYIQPSKQEGLPRALIEAMSRALPAIGTRVAGIPELLDANYLVKKGSTNEIVQALLAQMTIKEMEIQAERNFKKASEYSLDLINARRLKFFDKFILDNFNSNVKEVDL